MDAPGDEDIGDVAPRATVARRAVAIFGPRPFESAAWGAGIGVVFGVPFILPVFLAHAISIDALAWLVARRPPEVYEDIGLFAMVAVLLAVVSMLGTAGFAVLIARLRRASLTTTLLVAYFASFVPYLVFYFAIVRV